MQHTRADEKKICNLIKSHVCKESTTKRMGVYSKKAFTLIELLVVIAIIGLLSTIVLASLSSAREKARDAKKGQMVKQWQTAIEMYYYDNDNTYPDSVTSNAFVCLGEGYPDPGNGAGYVCLTDSKEVDSLNTALSLQYPSLPITEESMPTGTGGNYDARGIGYARCDRHVTACVSDEEYKIKWFLEDLDSSQKDCPIGEWISGGSGYDYCVFTQE